MSDYSQCSIYLAKSSIPNAGYGLYAGRNYVQGEILSKAYSVLISDSMIHNNDEEPDYIFNDYTWLCSSPSCDLDSLSFNEDNYLVSYFGSFANYHPYEWNAYRDDSAISDLVDSRFDDSTLRREDSPGAGASTYYYDSFYTSRAIQAGEELFLNYGDEWSTGRIEIFPLNENYIRATNIINKIVSSTENVSFEGIKDNATLVNQMEQDIKIVSLKLKKVDKLTASILPETPHEIFDLYNNGITSRSLSNRQRNIDWLEEHGKCMDNIRTDKSNIKDAGNGAFATRSIKYGELIAPVPLLQVNRTLLQMKELAYDEDGDIYASTDIDTTSQLMQNYCFGHDQSDIRLCMLSPGGMINHKIPCDISSYNQHCKQDRIDGPNAEIRWSTWDDTETWLALPLDEILKKPGRGISVDVIALRDIEANEEIFISYGQAWEHAWHNHVDNWHKSLVMVDEYKPLSSVSLTPDELLDLSAYPNIRTSCLWWETGLSNTTWTTPQKSSSHDRRVYEVDGSEFTLGNPKSNEAYYWPCDVQEIDGYNDHDGSRTYRVVLNRHPKLEDPLWFERGYKVVLTRYPLESISLVNGPYDSDQYLSEAFRRHIDLPNGMFPEQWKT